ncbi:MAG: MmgE/PrpD family protein [Betaproteobacteria bacterium]|nr:MmgE/PrpD family protein [Betaproteobacteria bacterium]
MALTLELAKRINSLSFNELPDAAIHWAKVGILDMVGVTLAGSREDATRIVENVTLYSMEGPSLIFGRGRRAGPLDAALVNGTASHALDYDDCNNTFGGHPSVPVLPALFALADDIGASGREFLAAYVAGFETECKIAMGVQFHHYTKGWHPTATLGVFGSAAACSKLLRLPDDKVATALAIAASLASGIKSNFGTMVKPLHIGHCTRNGLFAALLARDGFTAGDRAFEHKQGFFNVFNGEGNYDAAKILPAWAKPLDIVKPGIAIKQYPCCGSTHSALDAILGLAREHKPAADDIERVDVWTHTRRLEHTNRPEPKSDLDAKFSVQYCMVRALLDRKIAIEHFEGKAFDEPAVRRLLPRVHAAPYTTAQFPAENHFGAEVRITLRGGAVLSAKTDQPFGRTSDNPLPASLLKEKFDNCAVRVLPGERAAQLYSAIQGFENLKDVREVTAIIASETRKQAAA